MARTKALAKQVLSTATRTKLEVPLVAPGKKRRWKSGRRAVWHIKRTQKDCRPYWIGKLPMDRLVREIVKDMNMNITCLQGQAIDYLRAASDQLLTELFRAANLIAVNNKRQTISVADFKVAVALMVPSVAKP
jgi:histone H3/H4